MIQDPISRRRGFICIAMFAKLEHRVRFNLVRTCEHSIMPELRGPYLPPSALPLLQKPHAYPFRYNIYECLPSFSAPCARHLLRNKTNLLSAEKFLPVWICTVILGGKGGFRLFFMGHQPSTGVDDPGTNPSPSLLRLLYKSRFATDRPTLVCLSVPSLQESISQSWIAKTRNRIVPAERSS